MLPGHSLVKGHHLCMLQGGTMILEGLLRTAGKQAGVAVQLYLGGLAAPGRPTVGGCALVLPQGRKCMQGFPLQPTQLLSLPHGHLYSTVCELAAGGPVAAWLPTLHKHAVAQRWAVLGLWPHFGELALAVLGADMDQECGTGSMPRALSLGVHRAKTLGAVPEAVGTEQLKVATKLREDGIGSPV